MTNHLPRCGFRFGIIAAMSRNTRVIGVDNRIPWNVPRDRQDFMNVTRNKIMLVGRRTFDEQQQPTTATTTTTTVTHTNLAPATVRSHLAHAAHTIVVSRSLTPQDTIGYSLAPSVPDALQIAQELLLEKNMSNTNEEEIQCWICGGEAIYDETILHPSAERVILTVLDVEVPYNNNPQQVVQVARFPDPSLWVHSYTLKSSTKQMDAVSKVAYTVLDYQRNNQITVQ